MDGSPNVIVKGKGTGIGSPNGNRNGTSPIGKVNAVAPSGNGTGTGNALSSGIGSPTLGKVDHPIVNVLLFLLVWCKESIYACLSETTGASIKKALVFASRPS